MGSLKDEAVAYQPPETLNISDLDKIPVEIEVLCGEGKDKDGQTFKYKYIEVEGRQYRIPGIVLGGIKAILEKMPYIRFVSVLRQGTGLATKYQVIPWQAPESPPETEGLE